MTQSRAAAALALAALASLALSWSIGSSFAQDPELEEPAGELVVEFAFQPDSLVQLVDRTPATVLAEVETIRPAAPIVVETGDPEIPSQEIPTSYVDLEVVDEISGAPPQQLTLFKLGAEQTHPEADPAYAVGERYLLFVERRLNDQGTELNPDGSWLVVAPDGRLEELPSGELDAQVAGPVAQELDGESVTEAEQQIAEAEAGS